MLSREFIKQGATKKNATTIKFPKQYTVEKSKINKKALNTSGELEENCKFSNEPVAGTPPDKYFMHNLLLRMEKA
jgi:hypothetical protein